ncbi:hypothetical protein [Cryobacterium sp. PH29-G1]|uniref:hypothetical protein n=1 Tax=Cryobacterium sp. PH29-G1 TaxID=3046211 RepID=UPI0024BB0C4D|nr:hypothetical protein [Cryobacterium sp. PH29-G1]MDJ0349870.1 hypothetical protein [Cryobacterium sp. PH29-G1]
MRWDDLFNDLEGQLERELHAEAADLRLDAERQRLEKLSLRTRLSNTVRAAGPGGALRLRVVLVSGESLMLQPTTLGRDWIAADLLVADVLAGDRPDVDQPGVDQLGAEQLGADQRGARGRRVQCVIPLSAIAGVLLTAEQSRASLAVESDASARLIERVGFPFVLRDLCRRRRSVELETRGGVLAGTIDRVARDHFDLAVHPLGTLRRASEVTHFRLVPFWQIHVIRLQ